MESFYSVCSSKINFRSRDAHKDSSFQLPGPCRRVRNLKMEKLSCDAGL